MNPATLQFHTLCFFFLTLDNHAERVRCLKDMHQILREGEVE